MRHKEEIKLPINNFRLFDEALIDVGSLRWVVNESLPVLMSLWEESLSDTLVHDDERDLGWVVFTLLTVEEAILLLDDLIQLF
jgi:hypothetical protein